jgi:hypothetical protein
MVSDEVGGYHGRAELGLAWEGEARGHDMGSACVCGRCGVGWG